MFIPATHSTSSRGWDFLNICYAEAAANISIFVVWAFEDIFLSISSNLAQYWADGHSKVTPSQAIVNYSSASYHDYLYKLSSDDRRSPLNILI